MTDSLHANATGDMDASVNVNAERGPGQLAYWKFWTTVFVIGGLVMPFFYFGYEIAPRESRSTSYALTVAVFLTGSAFGWVLGIFISPIEQENKEFLTYGKAVAAGVSGYALAKIDPLLSSLLMEKTVFEVQNSFRLMGFVVCFIVAMLGAFGWRRYT